MEERYKSLPSQERAKKINEEMRSLFCVAIPEIKRWKQIVKTMEKCSNIATPELPPTHYVEIAKLPEEKQLDVIREVAEKKLTYKETALLVDKVLGKESPPLPKTMFDIIYADPPWEYDLGFLDCSPQNHYRTMSVEDICSLPVPSCENAVLFLWSTNPMLGNAFRVMEAWGFSYKTNLVWVKNRMGVGCYFRGQHELLLVAVKGKVAPPEESRRFSSILVADVGKHSEKPEQVYTLIEMMYPNRKYLELFARQKHEGWQSWGNELEAVAQ